MLREEASIAKGRAYRTLDDFATLAAAQTVPESLLEGTMILDEVQRCPELLLAIKQRVDADRRPGNFVLSGSANLSLLGAVSESLAGRAAYLSLQPMTRREIRRGTEAPSFLATFLKQQSLPNGEVDAVTEQEILLGGLPPACLTSLEGAREWFRGYVQTYVERDVRQLSQITDLVSFRTLAQLVAMRTGQLLVVSSLSRDAKMPIDRARHNLNLLETSFLVRRLPPFLKNRSSRLIKSPKVYITDSGLAAYLAGVHSLEPGQDGLMRGALFETYVAQNLAALLEAHLPDAQLGFWSEQGRHEVDFVIESGRDVIAIEVKATSRWSPRDLSGLNAFLDRTPACKAAVLAYNGQQAAQLGDRLFAIPLGHLLA